MRAWLASGNAHKARELAALLPGWRIDVLDMAAAPEESGVTFRENAIAKALYGATVAPAGATVLGEDSGIEVDALDGRPGIFSARFAGPGADDAGNNAKLLAELAGTAERGGRYVCELVARLPGGAFVHGRGVLEGAVGLEPRGAGGFGYDPLFVPAGELATVAELGGGWKRLHSHRAQAARALLAVLPPAASGDVPCARFSGVDPHAVLTDLLDVSGQVESAIVIEHAGGVLASTVPPERASGFERAVRDMLAEAQATPGSGREALSQLRVALEDGCVFVVQDDARIAAAVTVPYPTPGLVFYDLKNCLRQISGEARAPQPAPWDGSEEGA